jgi:hypothetical protein
MESDRQFLRHTLATLAYRCGKTLRDAPENFATYSGGTRPPAKILAHIGDLMDWAVSMAIGKQTWRDSEPLPWPQEVERFYATVKKFDDALVSDKPLAVAVEKLFQGPVADALTHTGQLAMLRRMAGCPVKGENYFVADVSAGRVGKEQAAAKKEFD